MKLKELKEKYKNFDFVIYKKPLKEITERSRPLSYWKENDDLEVLDYIVKHFEKDSTFSISLGDVFEKVEIKGVVKVQVK